MAEGVFNTFHDAAEFFRLAAGDTGSANRQIDDFRNRKHAHDHRAEIEAVPQVKSSQSVTQWPRLRVDGDGSQHQADSAGEETLDQLPARPCADESYTQARANEHL